MSSKDQQKTHPKDWTFMFVALVMSLALTRVGGKLFASDSAPPRKFAVIATGYYNKDSESLKESRRNDALKTYDTLVQYGYQVSWLFTGQTKDPQGVSGALLKTVFDWSEHIGDSQNGLKNGDQVLILVRAHGEPNRPTHNLHRVDFGDGPKMDMESLRPYLSKMHEARIKVALIDSSCYSGNSIELGSTGTCVITSQNRYNMGRVETLEFLPGKFFQAYDFDHGFQKALMKNPEGNLEEIFLESRKYLHDSVLSVGNVNGILDFFKKLHYENDLPEISSTEHLLLRPIWDRLFSLDQTEKWNRDIRSLESVSQIVPRLARDFEQKAIAVYEGNPEGYNRFRELMQKRVAWINELSSIERDALSNQALDYSERKDYLMSQLSSLESEYQSALSWLFYNERNVYESLYRNLSGSGLPSNACREFRL